MSNPDPDRDPPNVLLVVLDSVRANNCGLYGHDNATTPFLSSLGDEWTVFEQARSPSVHSIASHASLFSGYHVEEHNVTEHESRLDPDASVWTGLGVDHGYRTGIFTPNVVITESSNLHEPFGTYVGPKRTVEPRLFEDAFSPSDLDGHPEPVPYLRAALDDDRPVRALLNGVHHKLNPPDSHDPETERAGAYVDEFLAWADGTAGPWAACLNLMDAHYPYVPAAEHDLWAGDPVAAVRDDLPSGPLARTFLGDDGRPWGQLRAMESLYDGCIRQLDAALERLVGALDRRGVLDETLVVITSDHGEAFGERSRLTPAARLVDHGWGIDEVLTHVPLVVREPGGSGRGRVGDLATLTNFPDAVRAAVRGDRAADAFVPDDGVAVASTYRIRPPGDVLPLPGGEREPYYGPWRAVYRDAERGVIKHARRDGDAATTRVVDSRTAYRIGHDDEGVVDDVFGGMDDRGVAVGDAADHAVDPDVEQKLADLGYLR